MSQFSRSVTVDWQGSVKEGNGDVKAGTGAFTLPVTFPRRIGEPEGTTSPEELMAAAHGACYAMALNAFIGKKGGAIAKTHITCTVSAVFDNGITIQKSKLEVEAEGLTGVEASDFPALAKEASDNCPVSKVLKVALEVEVVGSVK